MARSRNETCERNVLLLKSKKIIMIQRKIYSHYYYPYIKVDMKII